MLPALLLGSAPAALAQTGGQRPAPDTLRTQRLGSVEVRAQEISTAKTALSAEATASPAAVTLVGRDYVARQAVTSYGDLLRPLAGISVSNFQLGGVAYGIQMRGYTVTEHARDIAFTIDGALQNQGSSLSANGLADLNPLIPEIVRRIEVVRGPFSPFLGDHAMGGSIAFETEDRLASSLTLSGGTYGLARGLGIVGFGQPGSATGGYIAVDAGRTDNYRDNSLDRHLNGLGKLSFALPGGTASLRVQGYADNSGSASYLKRADIESGKVNRTDAVNPTDGGITRQQNAVFNYKSADPAKYFSTTLYVQHHDFRRFRDPGGSQRLTRDNRVWGGGDVRYTRQATLGVPVLAAVGLSYRTDAIENTRFSTKDRAEVQRQRERTITTHTPSAYAQVQVLPVERVKLTLGGRYDQLYYDIRTGAGDLELANKAVKTNTGVFSPKVGAAFNITSVVSVFGNYSRGFKGPSGYDQNLVNADLDVSRLTSYEAGFSADEPNGRFHGLLTAYRSEQTGEIQADPLLLTPINFGRTRRQGLEAEGRVQLGTGDGAPALFANYSHVAATLRNGAATDEYVTNTPRQLATLGLDLTLLAVSPGPHRLHLSTYGQLVGPKYLNVAGTQQTKTYGRLSGKLFYTRTTWANFRVYVEGSFYPGTGALDEMTFLSGPDLLTAPQPRATCTGGVKIPLSH